MPTYAAHKLALRRQQQRQRVAALHRACRPGYGSERQAGWGDDGKLGNACRPGQMLGCALPCTPSAQPKGARRGANSLCRGAAPRRGCGRPVGRTAWLISDSMRRKLKAPSLYSSAMSVLGGQGEGRVGEGVGFVQWLGGGREVTRQVLKSILSSLWENCCHSRNATPAHLP